MNLINQLFFSTMISSVTSTLLLAVWWMLRNFFMLVNAKLIYITLRWICLMYLFPIGYTAVLLTYKGWFRGQSGVWKLVFAFSDKLAAPLAVIAAIWFLIAAGMVTDYYAREYRKWKRRLADNMPEEDPKTIRVYYRVCQELGLSAKRLKLIQKIIIRKESWNWYFIMNCHITSIRI